MANLICNITAIGCWKGVSIQGQDDVEISNINLVNCVEGIEAIDSSNVKIHNNSIKNGNFNLETDKFLIKPLINNSYTITFAKSNTLKKIFETNK